MTVISKQEEMTRPGHEHESCHLQGECNVMPEYLPIDDTIMISFDRTSSLTEKYR